jgi:hypothetical protein
VRGVTLASPAEFLSLAEPPAEDFLCKLQRVKLLATRPLSYAEVAASPPATLLAASHMYVRRGGTVAPLRGPIRCLIGPGIFSGWRSLAAKRSSASTASNRI